MKRIACLVAAIILLAGMAGAQENRATIQGTVKDSQGGLIANATVVVINMDTKTTVDLKSSPAGRYLAPLLQPGNYTVTAEATGFKKEVREGIVLLTTDVRDVDLTLQVGTSAESVTVTGEAPLVDNSHTDNGMALDDRTVRDLPVMTDVVTSMIQFAPGVQTNGNAQEILGPHSTQGGSDYSNGSGVGGNVWTIDGALSNGNGRNTSLLPSVDTVTEAKIVDNTFDGSFGHAVGLGITITTKSGTNEFHGVGSENYWSQRWQGSNLFTKQTYYANYDKLLSQGNTAGAAAALAVPIQPSGHSNLYSGTVTGPIYIPHVIDLRNKVFWTFGYNGEHDAKPEQANTFAHVVPSAAEKTGNFSDMLGITSDGLNYQLYDPFSVKVDPNRTGTHYIRTPIPGNILPATYINMGAPYYSNYIKYWPNPNNWLNPSQAQNTGLDDFQGTSTPYNWLFGQYSGRMDINLSDKMRIFGRFIRNHFVEYRGDWTYFIVDGYNNSNSNGSGVTRDDQNGVLDFVYTLTPTTILHAAGSVSNWMSYTTTLPYAFQFKPSSAGLPSYLDSYCGSWCYLPQMNITGYSTNGISGAPNPIYNRFYDYNADVYHNVGSHQFRAGADLRQETRSNHAANSDGNTTFNNTYFRQYDDAGPSGTYTPATLGLGWAAFMMGLPSSTSVTDNASYLVSNQFAAAFLQDTWRATPKLTVTLALRAEWEDGAKGSNNNYIVGWNSGAVLPISAAAQSAYATNPIPELPASNFVVQGGPMYGGTPGAPSRAWSSQLMWLPRVGFGYQLDSKTVIRGGYGIYYDTLDVNALVYGENNTGYSTSTSTTFTTTNGVTWGSNGACGAWCNAGATLTSPLSDLFPVRPNSGGTRFNVPVGNTLGDMGFLGVSGGPSAWTEPASKHPRMQRWRLGIERQIFGHDLVSIGYTGARTDSLNVNENLSGLPSSLYYVGALRPMTSAGATISCAAGVVNATANGCLQDTNLGANVTNPFAIANFASLATSNPALYSAISSQGFFTSATISKANLLKPYPTSNLTIGEPIGHERETELDAAYTHRFSHGVTANLGYTYFDSAYANSFFQPWNPTDPNSPQTPIWQINNIAPSRVTATWVFDLPFGKGRHWVHSTVPAAIVGGWIISGSYNWQLGTLIQLPNAFYYGNLNAIKISNPTIGEEFNTAGCVLSAAQAAPGDVVVPLGQPCTQGWDKRVGAQPGTYQARVLPYYVPGVRNPSYGIESVSLARDFRFNVKEHPLTFQLRADALDLFNHSNLGGVGTGVTSGPGVFGAITAAGGNLNRFIQIQGHIRW
ncbi:MAG: carboxypeptidase-like regulatory domain-containing protein [Bryobacteraceae bacterium]